jgi:type II secretion system protein H
MRTLAIGNMRTKRSSQSAFTLIELMVVIVLMVILTALILPEMRGTFEDAVLRSTGRKLVSAMNLAHSRAVTLQQTHRVVLDVKSERFVVERMAREGEGSGYTAVSDIPGGTGPLDKRITIEVHKDGEANPEMVSFYPNGTAEAAQIVMRDREGFALAVKVNGITARVSAHELGRE